MSLLADLLSKVKHLESGKEVAPNLRNIVKNQSALRRRLVLLLSICVLSALAGLMLVYFLQPLTHMVPQQAADSRQPASDRLPSAESGIKQVEKATQKAQGSEKMKDIPAGAGHADIENKVAVQSPPHNPLPSRPGNVDKRRENSKNTQFLHQKTIPSPLNGEGRSADSQNNNAGAAIDALLFSARQYEMVGDYSGALSAYRSVLDMDKNNFAVMNSIAYMMLRLGMVTDSIKYAQMALDGNGNYVPAMINLGIAYARTEDALSAKTNFNRALSIEPNNKYAVLNLALLNESRKDYQEAMALFSRLARAGDMAGSLGIARIYGKQGKKDEALRVYNGLYSSNSLDAETKKIITMEVRSLSRD
jgi:tetratricopeptide (TPR) repeat protein